MSDIAPTYWTERAKERKTEARQSVDSLPAGISRNRILTLEEACEYVGSSPTNWRKLRRMSLAPPGVLIGLRRLGWRIADLDAYLETRREA